MLEKFLRVIVSNVVGKQAEDIVDLLNTKKHVNEFLIAKKLDITINQTRNILYRLSDHGLVSSIRKKDKKKGWYTYFWKIEIIKSLEFLKEILNQRKNQIEAQIKSRELKQFYVCGRCHIEFNEENALVHEFTCNECGDLFTIKDNTKVLRELKKNFNKFEKELSLIEEEIEKERGKMEKVKLKIFKKEEKEKVKKKAEAAAKRKAAREKIAALKSASSTLAKDKGKGIIKKATKKKIMKKSLKKKSSKKVTVSPKISSQKDKGKKKIVKKKFIKKGIRKKQK